LFRNKNILITGGTGSWGQELVTQLLDLNPNKIIVFSRGELAQVNMERKFQNKKLEFVIGDVRDQESVNGVMRRDINYVFHLAALKHVPVCENQPQETIKTNIGGTINLINSAIKYQIDKFIDVSTDKAVSPINLYGYTKAVGEKLTIQANNLTNFTQFVCVRGGNVIGSNGSVVPLFIKQIKDNNEITITDSSMTRFFLTLPQAIKLLFQAAINSICGDTYVMNMPSFLMQDIATHLIDRYGDKNTKIKTIGRREGEKTHEVLISSSESSRAFIVDKNYFCIQPEIKIKNRIHEYIDKTNFIEFSSKNRLENIKYFENLLTQGGY